MNIKVGQVTKSGRVRIGDTIIQSYPEMEPFPLDNDDTPVIKERVLAEEKAGGANIRVWYYNGEIIALTRGGFREPKAEAALEKVYGNNLKLFFRDFPNIVICGEIIGKDTIANVNAEWYQEHYGSPTVFLIFDMFETGENGEWWGNKRIDLVCIDYHLHQVLPIGYMDRGLQLLDIMKTVREVNEGVVIKAIPRVRNQVWKLKWEHFSKHFQDRIIKKEKTKWVSEAEQIVDHFLQGYHQPELGLREGLPSNAKEWYEKALKELGEIARTDRTKIGAKVGEISEALFIVLIYCGEFTEEQQRKLVKVIKQRLGRVVSQAMAHVEV